MAGKLKPACVWWGIALGVVLAGLVLAVAVWNDRRRKRQRLENLVREVVADLVVDIVRNRGLTIERLESLHFACRQYARDNEEYPSDLGALFPHYVTDGEQFLCPWTGEARSIMRTDLPPDAKDASGVLGPRHTDYGYVAGLGATGSADWIVIFEKARQLPELRNVIRLGGRINSLSEQRFMRELEKTLREARVAGYDARVWGYASGESPL